MHRWTALIQRRFEAGRTDVRDRLRGLPDWVERFFKRKPAPHLDSGADNRFARRNATKQKLKPVRFDSIKTE